MASIRSRLIKKTGKKILYLDYTVDGERQRESLGIEDTRENRKLMDPVLKALELDISRGMHMRKTKAKIISLFDAFELFKQEKYNKKPKTISAYECAYNKLASYIGADTLVRDITDETVRKFHVYLMKDVSHNTIENYFRHLKIMFKFLREKGYTKDNPFFLLEPKETEIEIIPDKVYNTVLKHLMKKPKCEHQARALKLLWLTGFRVSTAQALRWEQINFDEGYINPYNVKKDRPYLFPLYKELQEFLLSFRQDSGLVLGYTSINSFDFWRHALDELEMPRYKLHSVRKTFLTRWAQKKIALLDLANLADHRDTKTTRKYYLLADTLRLKNEMEDKLKPEVKKPAKKSVESTDQRSKAMGRKK